MDIIILILLMLVIYGLHSNEKLIRMNRDTVKNYVDKNNDDVVYRSTKSELVNINVEK